MRGGSSRGRCHDAPIHARTDNGAPTFDTEVYREIYDEVRDRTEILVDFSTRAVHEQIDSRVVCIKEVRSENAALSMGSMNYAKYSENREEFVFDEVFDNSFDEIRSFFAR